VRAIADRRLYKPADPRVETGWWEESRRGVQQARNDLIDQYLPFARMLAAKYYAHRHVEEIEFDDFFQYAITGLIEAIDRFDPARGVKFTDYAGRRIEGAILDGIEKATDRQQQISMRARIRRARAESLKGGLNGAEDTNAIFDGLADVAMGLALGFMLEDSGMFAAGEERHADSATDKIELRELCVLLLDLIEQMPKRERDILRYLYFDELSQEKVGAIVGLTKGRVSQIHKEALARLRKLFLKATRLDLTL